MLICVVVAKSRRLLLSREERLVMRLQRCLVFHLECCGRPCNGNGPLRKYLSYSRMNLDLSDKTSVVSLFVNAVIVIRVFHWHQFFAVPRANSGIGLSCVTQGALRTIGECNRTIAFAATRLVVLDDRGYSRWQPLAPTRRLRVHVRELNINVLHTYQHSKFLVVATIVLY